MRREFRCPVLAQADILQHRSKVSVPIADIHSVTSLACAMSVGEYCQAYYLGRAKNLRMPNYEPQTPARKRAMTTIIATCIVPWNATA